MPPSQKSRSFGRGQDPGLEVMLPYGKIESEIAQLPPEEPRKPCRRLGCLSLGSTASSAHPMSCWVSVRSLRLVKKKSVPGPSRKACWRHKRPV